MTIVAFYGMWMDIPLLTIFGSLSVTVALLLSVTGCIEGAKKKVE